MGLVPKESIEVIAQSIGITNLSPDASLPLAPDVEYRVREIMQEAIKCMRHSRRTVLTCDDVDSALSLRNVERVYGFASGEALMFKKAGGCKDLYYIEDKDVDFRTVVEAPLPRALLDAAVNVHWLAIEGVQPAIPENAPVEAPTAIYDGKKLEYKNDSLLVDIKTPVKHVLSRELQLYFEKMTELTTKKPNSHFFKQALMSLLADAGLHPLVPYFIHFIADEVTRNLSKFHILFALMRITRNLLGNPHIHLEPYLHQVMPSIMTCLVAKQLGNRPTDNHWELRNFAANLIASICERFGHAYHNLRPRVVRTLLHVFLDPIKSFPQHYGAIQGLAALGPNVVRLLILPNLEPYMSILEPEMSVEKQKNEMKRYEAWRVYGALMCAAGLSMLEKLKMLPALLKPANRTVWKKNARVATAFPNKRKASTDNLPQQPLSKKQAIEGTAGLMAMNSVSMDMKGVSGGLANAAMGATGPMTASQATGPMASRNVTSLSNSAVLAQAWREDIAAGPLLASLVGHFGESIFTFIPKPELCMFL